MSDMLQDGFDWLRGQRKAHMTHAVTYRRGEDSVALDATVGKTVFRMMGLDGVETVFEMRDFLVDTTDLLFDAVATLPQVGDRIEETGADDQTYVYEVLEPGNNEPHWRYCDATRGTLRIHTKHVETK